MNLKRLSMARIQTPFNSPTGFRRYRSDRSFDVAATRDPLAQTNRSSLDPLDASSEAATSRVSTRPLREECFPILVNDAVLNLFRDARHIRRSPLAEGVAFSSGEDLLRVGLAAGAETAVGTHILMHAGDHLAIRRPILHHLASRTMRLTGERLAGVTIGDHNGNELAAFHLVRESRLVEEFLHHARREARHGPNPLRSGGATRAVSA